MLCGVQQDNTFGSTIFRIYFNDLLFHCLQENIYWYVDTLRRFVKGKYNKLQYIREINKIIQHAEKSNNISFNTEKKL